MLPRTIEVMGAFGGGAVFFRACSSSDLVFGIGLSSSFVFLPFLPPFVSAVTPSPSSSSGSFFFSCSLPPAVKGCSHFLQRTFLPSWSSPRLYVAPQIG